MQPGLLLRYEPELNAFLDLLIWRLSIWVDRPTPGNALMDLRYRDERSYDAIAAAGKGLLFNSPPIRRPINT
jgi:peroxin-2